MSGLLFLFILFLWRNNSQEMISNSVVWLWSRGSGQRMGRAGEMFKSRLGNPLFSEGAESAGRGLKVSYLGNCVVCVNFRGNRWRDFKTSHHKVKQRQQRGCRSRGQTNWGTLRDPAGISGRAWDSHSLGTYCSTHSNQICKWADGPWLRVELYRYVTEFKSSPLEWLRF